MSKIKPLDKHWKETNYRSGKNYLKNYYKNNLAIVLNVFYAKKEKYILSMFQDITQIVKNKSSL